MNKKLVFWSIALVALCIGSYFWLHGDNSKPPVPAKQLAAINNSLSTSAGQSKLPPATSQQKPPVQQQASAPVAAPAPVQAGVQAGGIAGSPTENAQPKKIIFKRQQNK